MNIENPSTRYERREPMPDHHSPFIHSIGDKIRIYRKYRGMTQKELGEKCGLGESTIRNYELGNRYPDRQTLTQIADVLRIDMFSLLDPDPTDPTSALHVLFDLERCYGLIPKKTEDGQLSIVLDQNADTGIKKALTSQEKQKRLQFRENLSLWAHVRKVYDEGNLLDEEYDDWKIAWPDFIDQDQLYGYTEDPEIAEQLQKQFSENKTTAKTESEGRAKRKRKPKKQQESG